MKIMFKAAVAVMIVTSASAPVVAQNGNSASAATNGSTTIVAPITITENSSLAFGSVVKPTAGTNTVTLDPSTCTTSLSTGGNAALLTGASHDTPACATYTAEGEDGLAFSISTDTDFDMDGPGGASLTVTLTKSAATGTIGTDADFSVGGSFDVADGTPAGAYTGSFNVTVTYQ